MEMGNPRRITGLHRFFDRLVDCGAFASGIILGVLVLLVSLDIFMRYFINKPIPGTLESAEYGLLFLTLLAAPWLLRKNKHVRMELLVGRLKPSTQALVNGVTSSVCVVICGIIAYYGILVVIDNYQTGQRLNTTLEPIAFPLLSVIPFSFCLLTIQFAVDAFRFFGEAKQLKFTSRQTDGAESRI